MPKKRITPLQKQSYEYFLSMGEQNATFTKQDVLEKSGYSESTVEGDLTKRWKFFLVKSDDHYSVDMSQFPKDIMIYADLMSQSNIRNREPGKPTLRSIVECQLNKARESAMLAIDTYNRPMTPFRTQGFTVMMIIAWTSLFHAIFERDSIDYHYYEKGKPKIIDGEHKTWELATCIEKYPISLPIKANLNLFILLRNKIEHRYAPAIDIELYGECQALLCNFEELLTKEFGDFYSMSEALAFSLQVLTCREPWQQQTMRQMQKKHYDELKSFITDYRAGLRQDVFSDINYSFRVFLVQKTGNHLSSSDIAIEFIKYDSGNPAQFESIEKNIALIKETRVQVANQGNYRPSRVAQKVSEAIGRTFNIREHTLAWKHYKVRASSADPQKCKLKYCQYDEAHGDFIYTQDWVDFLVKEIEDKIGFYAETQVE